MRIAHIVCAFPPYRGGMGNSAYHFSRLSAEMGHEVTVFTPDYSRSFFGARKNAAAEAGRGGFCGFEDIVRGEGGLPDRGKLEIARLWPLFSYGNAAILPQLFWRLKGFDIIYLHYPFYGSAALTLAGKILAGNKAELIVHYHMDTIAFGLKGLIFKVSRFLTLPFLARFAKVITCASLDYIKHSDLAPFYGRYRQKFKQTLFGVDLERFKPAPASETKKEKIILFVGGLDEAHYFKGVGNLLLAFKKIVQLAPSSFLVIVGEGGKRPFYEELARQLGVADKTKFTGAVSDEDLPRYYQKCDCVVLPSINEGEAFGLVLLEAMAAGKPVIASNLPGVRSVFKNNKEGMLVEPNSIGDLIAKLKIILTNDALAARMGEAARLLAEKKYSWEKVKERLDIIYHYAKYAPRQSR